MHGKFKRVLPFLLHGRMGSAHKLKNSNFMPHLQDCRIALGKDYESFAVILASLFMNTTQAIFHRTQTAKNQSSGAKNYCIPDAFDVTAHGGVFITGNRKIGKTVFLRQDLMPELKRKGAVAIHLRRSGKDGCPSFASQGSAEGDSGNSAKILNQLK